MNNLQIILEDEKRVQIFRALADETRIQIVRVLKQKGKELSCSEIGEFIDIPKSTVSYHFKILREAGLTITRKESLNRFVSLRLETFRAYLPGFLETL